MQRNADDFPKTAIIYDFDGTLARGNIQEKSFMKAIGIPSNEFWGEVKKRAEGEDADEILCYMKSMLDLARKHGVLLTRDALRAHGSQADLFDGLAEGDWFIRTNAFAAAHGLELEHYVISSGTHEMIEGCQIFQHFKQVFGSKYLYENGEAVWPALAINYTTKTQFLFRINKGIQNSWDPVGINSFIPESDRRIPFSRMIFIGDGDTDIPSMKMMKNQGGYSVAVFDPVGHSASIGKIHKLISEDRVNFVAPADYRPQTPLDIIVKGIIGRIARLTNRDEKPTPSDSAAGS